MNEKRRAGVTILITFVQVYVRVKLQYLVNIAVGFLLRFDQTSCVVEDHVGPLLMEAR